MDAREALAVIAAGKALTRADAEAAMGSVMAGEATPAQLGALLAALRVRGETVDEITGFAAAMRGAAVKLTLTADAIDIVGTGGSRVDPFNISTVASVVAAAAGAKVAKHGNRAASGKCGAADVLEALGVKIDLGPDGATRCIDEVGMAFLFAARYHPAMRHAGPVRREIGIRTVFNVLGPLANPARVRRMVLGVATPELGETMARVLGELGADHVMVVHGEDGLDEISPTGRTLVWELRGDAVHQSAIDPVALGLPLASVADILSGDASANAASARSILSGDASANAASARSILGGEKGARRNAVLLNAGAALIVAGLAGGMREGMAAAARAIDSGGARDTLDRLIATSQRIGAAEAAAV